MNKNITTYSFIGLLILFIIISSFILIIDPKYNESIKKEDVYKTISINDKDLDVIYYESDDLDIDITYGNIYEKYIKITNNNDEDLVYSLKYVDSNLSNDKLLYSIYISYDDNTYLDGIIDSSLVINSSLIHNVVINAHSSNTIKIVFKSNYEKGISNIKGKLVVSDNLSQLELFNISLKNLNEALEDKINKLNGIYNKGYYILNINELTFINDANLLGYILVDAEDISDIKYIYTIYNDKYMVKNSDYKNINIANLDPSYIETLTTKNVCNQYDTRITCSNFSSIPKSPNNIKLEFYNSSKEIINYINNNININDDKTYIYEIPTDIEYNTNLNGYILINKDDMYLYLRNNLFMISGYNFNKLGDYDIKSKTIRSYNSSAWNLSANNKNEICKFSGYTDCYDKEGNKI